MGACAPFPEILCFPLALFPFGHGQRARQPVEWRRSILWNTRPQENSKLPDPLSDMSLPKAKVTRAILLAGGRGQRMLPMTRAVNKHLLPVYDKPLIHYPLACLIAGGIETILIVTSPEAVDGQRRLVGNGSQWGIQIDFAVQDTPAGIVDGLLAAGAFAEAGPLALALGDNLFMGPDPGRVVTELSRAAPPGAAVWTVPVEDPTRYGVVEMDDHGRPVRLHEKPASANWNLAVPGIYVYDERVVRYARQLRPSRRGELEVTDLNQAYLSDGALSVIRLPQEITWMDIGDPDDLWAAAGKVRNWQQCGNGLVGCVAEAAFRAGRTSGAQFKELAGLVNPRHGNYLRRLAGQPDEAGRE